MSETLTEAPATEAPAPATDTEATPAPAETQATTEAPQEPETPAEPPPPEKPKQADRRFAHMTAKLAQEQKAREAIERELQATKALLNANKEDTKPGSSGPVDIEREAERLLAQRDADRQRQSLVEQGRKEYGAEAWDQKAEVLHGMGATTNPAFMEALVGLPGAAKLVSHLADDADALVSLLGKSPVAMAAEMGRMVAEISRPASKPISNAPRPITPISTPAVVAEPTEYDSNLSMKEYAALRAKTAPRHLGGMGKR